MKAVESTQAPSKITENSYGGWECLCGNEATAYGFYPINDQNEEVEPTPDEWTTNLYACFQCGRLIDVDSLEIVRQIPVSEIRKAS
ncbi:hypothetical protein ACFWUU_04095 [Kribbella sp. NPDC058693]|uniref:hypothetical protein n=1 Tax=Kribbella sp. NPDC058693 TaxID=3346602 RepID=UPI00364E67BB